VVIEPADYILRRLGPLRALKWGCPNYFCAPHNPPSIFFLAPQMPLREDRNILPLGVKNDLRSSPAWS
jgi:hypothetical protein